MGFLFGSTSFSRFSLNGSPPKNYREEFPVRIAQRGFRGLDEDSDEERSTGWVKIMDMFDNQFTGNEFFMGPYLALTWRVDIRRVPSKALSQYSREAEDKVKIMEGLEYLSKIRRQEIKEGVMVQLLKRAIPQTKTYDTVWNLDTGLVLFGSTSSKVCGEFTEFFFNTFDLNLIPVFPYLLALQELERGGTNPETLDNLQPVSFKED